MTTDEIFDALERPFEEGEVKQREGDRGRWLSYIDAPTARRRLNQVLGRDGWECECQVYPNGVKCRLSITLPDGRTLSRSALGGYPKMPSEEDSFKGGDSDAFKRAAALFGVAAYLSDDNHPAQPQPTRQGANQGPQRPPQKERIEWGGRDRRPANGSGGGTATATRPATANGVPRTGKAFYGWVKDKEASLQVDLIRYVNGWAKLQEFPARMVDWSEEQVSQAHKEALRKLNNPHDD